METINFNQFVDTLFKHLENMQDLTKASGIIREVIITQVNDKYLAGGIPAWKASERAKEQGGRTLEDTGRLAASLQVTIEGSKGSTMITLSEADYGKYHEFGASINVTKKYEY
jgi:phage gpG-like protein